MLQLYVAVSNNKWKTFYHSYTHIKNRIAKGNFHMDAEKRNTTLFNCHIVQPGLASGQNEVFYMLAILYLQSLVVMLTLSFSLSPALNNLSCNATPGAVLNLLLLAEGPRSINKPRENNGLTQWASYQNCYILEGTGRRALHFLCYCRESSIIVILHFYSSHFHPRSLFSFPYFPSLLLIPLSH